MNGNLLTDLTDQLEQHRLNKELDGIKNDIKTLTERQGIMNYFVEVTVHHDNGTISKISINPYYIVMLEDRLIDDTECNHYVLLRNGTTYRVEESREEIIKKINGVAHRTIG